MNNWYSSIYKACVLASMVAFIIGFFSQSQTNFGAYIAGYSVLSLGIMMILVILFTNILKTTSNETSFQILKTIMVASGPFLLLLAVIAFVLYLLITNKTKIIEGQIAPGYNSFSNIIVLLLMLQVYLVYLNTSTDNFQSTGKMPRLTISLIYLLGVLTAICSIILSIILKYYSTDGFSTFQGLTTVQKL